MNSDLNIQNFSIDLQKIILRHLSIDEKNNYALASPTTLKIVHAIEAKIANISKTKYHVHQKLSNTNAIIIRVIGIAYVLGIIAGMALPTTPYQKPQLAVYYSAFLFLSGGIFYFHSRQAAAEEFKELKEVILEGKDPTKHVLSGPYWKDKPFF